MWQPRALLGAWTPDQTRVAAHFPAAHRVCVCAANGVGKTYLAADIAVSFLLDHPSALVLFTAPTQRQVEQLLWPEIVRRLKDQKLMPPDEPLGKPEWNREGGSLFGFATNQPERMQGFHARDLLIVVDETSGMTAELLEAMEAVALGANNYIFAIGNPNEPFSPFYNLTLTPSWRHETLSALTHPNILEKREVVPGATDWYTLLQRVKDWCRPTETPAPDSFSLELTKEEIAYLDNDEQTEPPRRNTAVPVKNISVETVRLDKRQQRRWNRKNNRAPNTRQHPAPQYLTPDTELRHFQPNDSFRVRYLGRFPSAGSDNLFTPEGIEKCMSRAILGGGRKFAALDVAREGGDSTVYALREGDAVTVLQEIQPGDFIAQADAICRLIRRDCPESLIIDCAGIGAGLKDILFARGGLCPIHEFQPASNNFAPQEKQRFLNRRAKAYGNLADAMRCNAISLPEDPELRADLAAIRYRHTEEQQLQILNKESIKSRTGRSPDRADAIAMLWESQMPPRLTQPRLSRPTRDTDFTEIGQASNPCGF
jgi:hypothetical protein